MTSQALKLAKQLSSMDSAPKDYADQVAADAVDAVDAKIDFAIIYPNGGTEATPANITTNQRLDEDNPFPGFRVQCEAQVLYSGEWGSTGFMYGGAGGYGVRAAQKDDDGIVVQSGSTNLIAACQDAGGVFGNPAAVGGPLPVRVLVRKVKGAVS